MKKIEIKTFINFFIIIFFFTQISVFPLIHNHSFSHNDCSCSKHKCCSFYKDNHSAEHTCNTSKCKHNTHHEHLQYFNINSKYE